MYPIERPLHDTERRKIVAEIRISFSTFYSWPTERGADPADNNSRTEAEWRSEQNGNAAWFMTDDVCLFSRDSFVIGSLQTREIYFFTPLYAISFQTSSGRGEGIQLMKNEVGPVRYN